MAVVSKCLCASVAVAVLALVVPTSAAAASPSAQDASFMKSNAQTNLAEISGASIALARSGTRTVRSLVQMIETDHQKAQSQLTALAHSLGFTVPSKPNSFELREAKTLKTASAETFDATYLQVQLQGHRASISNTQAEIDHGTDSRVVRFAKSYLPVAEKHLRMVSQAIAAERSGPAGVATPQSRPADVSSPVVTTGPLANGAKRKPSNDMWWLIGLGIVIMLGIGALLLRLKTSAHRRG
jgi:putative membrane protein